MNIQAEKLEIMKLILETDNPGILQSIKKIFKKEAHSDFWDSLSEEQKLEIKNGIIEADNGELVDYEVFIKKHK